MNRRLKSAGHFLLTLLLNLLLHLRRSIPAWILLALHFLLDWRLLWFWLALGIWVAAEIVTMLLLSWAARCGNEPDPDRPNRNPYSRKR